VKAAKSSRLVDRRLQMTCVVFPFTIHIVLKTKKTLCDIWLKMIVLWCYTVVHVICLIQSFYQSW